MFREVIVDHSGKTMAKIGENEGGLGESDMIIFGMLKLTRFLLVVLQCFQHNLSMAATRRATDRH